MGMRVHSALTCDNAGCEDKMVWQDGTAFTYWGAPYTIRSSHRSEDCIRMFNGNFDDRNCGEILTYICEFDCANPNTIKQQSNINS